MQSTCHQKPIDQGPILYRNIVVLANPIGHPKFQPISMLKTTDK